MVPPIVHLWGCRNCTSNSINRIYGPAVENKYKVHLQLVAHVLVHVHYGGQICAAAVAGRSENCDQFPAIADAVACFIHFVSANNLIITTAVDPR